MNRCPSCSSFLKVDTCHLCEKLEVKEKPRYKKIRYASKKRAKDLRDYQVRRIVFLLKNPNCSVYPMLKATEIHHKSGRSGDMLLNEDYWLAVSRKAHNEIEANPLWSVSMGYTVSRLTTKD